MNYFAVALLTTRYFSFIHAFLLPRQITYHGSLYTDISIGAHPNDCNDIQSELNLLDSFDASRRSLVWQTLLSGAVATTVLTTTFPTDFAFASGGATAGKYTTIPIAKRRYYGRVQEAVHEFLLMGPSIVKGDWKSLEVQHFFDTQGTVIVEAKRKDVNGQCTKKDNDCKGAEIRDSRWNDMKASMYLLGNAFRINQQKAPDNLPTVQAAKIFFRKVDGLEKLVTNKNNKNKNESDASIASKAQGLYLDALDILDQYLDLVELPPTESGNYEQEFDTRVGATSRIT
jgi:hypothetical protein